MEILSMDAEDEDLFKGMVPQLEDWVHVWQAARGSFCEAARHLSTARWLLGTRGKDNVSSRAAHKMVSVSYQLDMFFIQLAGVFIIRHLCSPNCCSSIQVSLPKLAGNSIGPFCETRWR